MLESIYHSAEKRNNVPVRTQVKASSRSSTRHKVFEKTENHNEDYDEKSSKWYKFNLLGNQENELQYTHYYDHTALYSTDYVDWRILDKSWNISWKTEHVYDVNDPVCYKTKHL